MLDAYNNHCESKEGLKQLFSDLALQRFIAPLLKPRCLGAVFGAKLLNANPPFGGHVVFLLCYAMLLF